MYHDYENFLMTFEDNKLKFLKDVRYVGEKLQTLHDLTTSMFEYYDLREQFDQLMDKISIKDPDYIELLGEIEDTRTKFFTDRMNYIKIAEAIETNNDLMVKETEFLRTLIVNNNPIKLSLKVNAILKIYPKLLVFHDKIQNDIAQLKVIVHSLIARKAEADQIMNQLRDISEGKGPIATENADVLKKVPKIALSWMAVILMLI